MALSNIADRNYMDMLGSAGKEPVENLEKKYGIKYQTEEAGNLGYEDFLSLMITQLTNQDFTNPTDDSEYMAQLTQFGSLQAMQEMAKYSQNNYAMSMLGKTVSASKYSNGSMTKETGVVQQISRKDDEYYLTINGKSFTLKQIISVGEGEISENAGNGSSDTVINNNTTGNLNNTGGTQTAANTLSQETVDLQELDPAAAMG